MIFRTVKNKDNPYFQMNKSSVNDSELSFKAVGIHAYLMSKPDSWTASEDDIVKRHKDGRDSVRAGVQELINHGYMKRVRVTDDKGRVTDWRLDTYESPDLNPDFNPQLENPNVDSPESGFPEVENPEVENPHVVNIYSSKERTTSNSGSSSSSPSTDSPGSKENELAATVTEQANPSERSAQDWDTVRTAYESEIGMFTAMTSETVHEAMEEYGSIMVVDAIKAASVQNVRKWSYVDGILKRWKANGRPSAKPVPVTPKLGDVRSKKNLPDYMKKGLGIAA